MRKYLLFVTFLIVLTNITSAQTIKTFAGEQVQILDERIAEIQQTITDKKDRRRSLEKRYSSEYIEVKQINSEIEKLEISLQNITEERENLSKQKLTKPLPNNQIELLKIIIQQNQRIIELLEKQSSG